MRAAIESSARDAGRDPAELRVVLRIVETAGRSDEVARQLPALAAAGVDEVIVDVDWAAGDPARRLRAHGGGAYVNLLAGKTVAVTGGANGIGAAIVRRFDGEGARGVVLDLSTATAGDRPEGWRAVAVDVRDEASVAAAFADVGPVDIVVAAAGIVPGWATTREVDLDVWDEIFRVNVRGMIATFKHAAVSDGGSIVAIGSLNSWRGDPNIASYVASKHAVLGIVRSAALDLGRAASASTRSGPARS